MFEQQMWTRRHELREIVFPVAKKQTAFFENAVLCSQPQHPPALLQGLGS